MPRGKWIDKKSAQHFTLVHRQQNDPLIHDAEAPAMVLNPTNTQQRPKDPAAASSSSSSTSASAMADAFNKGKNISDLADELGSDVAARMRANEGEAASYGVYYDDTEYDYMQHLRDLDGGSGSGGGDVVFVEAKPAGKEKDKGKGKMGLEDALRNLDLDSKSRDGAGKGAGDLFDDDLLPSKNLQRQTYQAQQAVPDALAGFHPDMDPRLREVLEALEDDAYVEDGDGDEGVAADTLGGDDLFGQLTRDGRELDDFEFEGTYDEDEYYDDDGWESDGTAKPAREYNGDAPPDLVPVLNTDEAGAPVANDDWMEDFKAFKKDQKAGNAPKAAAGAAGNHNSGKPAPSVSDLQSSLMTTTTNGGRRKKRKGALTDTSSYSMTSSSLVRTEQLGILDARFEKISEQYEPGFDEGYGEDEDDDFPLDDDSQIGGGGAAASSVATGASTASTVGGRTRGDFDGILDDFLGGFSTQGKRHPRKPGISSDGLEQLDQIRRDLGPARLGKKRGPAPGAKAGKAAALAFGAPAGSSG